MKQTVMAEKVIVSACLMGVPCRWHGKRVSPSKEVKRWMDEHSWVELVPVCPEQLGGLPTPRPPVKTRKGHVFVTCADKARRNDVTGPEVTEAFEAGADATLKIARENGCDRALMFWCSPSCARGGKTGKKLIADGIDVIPMH